jgi:lipopolysaccharide export LptBFGC system permease protein LptF
VVQLDRYHLYRYPVDAQNRQALDLTVYSPTLDADEKKYERVSERIVALDHHIRVEAEKTEDGDYRNAAILNLTDCSLEMIQPDGSVRLAESKQLEYALTLDVDVEARISPKRVSDWPISKILRRMGERTERHERNMKANAERSATGQISTETFEAARQIYRKEYAKDMAKYRRVLHTRVGLSFSCVLFAVVGTLLGLVYQHGTRAERFGWGFGVAAVYFIVFLGCRSLSDYGGGWLWLPNVGMLVFALYLWRRAFWTA